MSRLGLKIVLLTLFLPLPVAGWASAAGKAVVILASERVMGQPIPSSFAGIANGVILRGNACEIPIENELQGRGFSLERSAISPERRREARTLHTVIGRYSKLSALPNEIAAQAAEIIDGKAVTMIACDVTASRPRLRKRQAGSVCARAECKAVDVKSKQRIAAATRENCSPEADRRAAAVATVQTACRDVGAAIATALAGRD